MEIEELQTHLPDLQKKLGYTFSQKDLLQEAFVHKSYVNEHEGVDYNNERLEFIGDSVFNLIVTEYLFQKKPEAKESELSLARSFLVDFERAASYLSSLGVAEYLVLGKGEKQNEGRGRRRLVANLFEAILGAVFIDGGFAEAQKFFLAHFSSHIDDFLAHPLKNWKMELQDWVQKNLQKKPIYQTRSEEGPCHDKQFIIDVIVEDRIVGSGMGPSKKIAQMEAARVAMQQLEGHS